MPWKAADGRYSGVYPLLHRGTRYLNFRVHLPRYPQLSEFNSARVDMRKNGVRIALIRQPSGRGTEEEKFATYTTPLRMVADAGSTPCGNNYRHSQPANSEL